jgi:hypothetical protein
MGQIEEIGVNHDVGPSAITGRSEGYERGPKQCLGPKFSLGPLKLKIKNGLFVLFSSKILFLQPYN